MSRIAEIVRYPVKSMLGESVAAARLTENGILGDRVWALRDEVRHALTGAKRFAPLLSMRARFLREPYEQHTSTTVELADAHGALTRSDAADVNEWLSERLGHPVSLWPLLPATADAHYRREPADRGADVEAGLREMFARTADEPLPDLSGFPPVLASHSAPPGTYFDAFPLLILSTSALATIARLARASGSESAFDMRRFRPNLVVAGAAQGFAEDQWCDRELRIGTARLRVEMRCPRCIVTTHGFLELPQDAQIMRSLVQHHGGDLGVYASVLEPGVINVGDAVELV